MESTAAAPVAETTAAPVAPEAPAAPVLGAQESVAAYREAKAAAEAAPVEAPAPAVTPEAEADSAKADTDVSEAARTLRRQRGEERKQKIQKEIDDLTRQRYALRAEVEAMQRGKTAPAPEAPQAPAAGKPAVEQFESYEDFAEALAEYKAREIVAAELARRDEAQAQTRTFDSFRERVAKFQEAHPDYVEALTNFPIGIPIEMESALRDIDQGPALAYHIATSPDGVATVERLAGLPPARMLIELGQLAAKLDRPASPPAPKPITKAPAPITPVGGPTTQPVARDPKEITSLKEYRARRDEFVGARS